MPQGVSYKRYTGEFEQIVVEDMINSKMSYRKSARKYEISDNHRPQKWERIYIEEEQKGCT